MANKKSNSKDLAEVEEIVKQSDLLNESASAVHNLFADLNKNEYKKYYQACLDTKQVPSKADFYEIYDLTYPNAKQQKDYAKRVYETALHFAADFPISQNLPEISALSLFAKEEFDQYVSSHKFVLPKNHTYGEAERQVAFFDEVEDELSKLNNAKSAKDLQRKRNLEEKLELSKNFARYLSDNKAQHNLDDYANIYKSRFEKFKATHPIEWLPEDLKAKIVDAYLKSAFYTEELLNGTMAQSQQYAEKAKHARTNGILAYADLYNNQYQEFLNGLSRDESGNLSVSEIQAKTAFYMRNGGSLSDAPIDGVQYYKKGDEHNLMFDIDAGSSLQHLNIVVKDGKSSLKLSDGSLAELNEEAPFVLNENKFIAQTNIGNLELPINEVNCQCFELLKNYPAQIPAQLFQQVDKKTYENNIQNITDVVYRGSPKNETQAEEIEPKNLVYKAGDVNYCYFPYKTEANEDSYFRVMQKDGKPYINLQNPTTNATETYEIEAINELEHKLFLQVQKDGLKTIEFPIPYKEENLEVLKDFYLFTAGKDFPVTEITIEQCPNVPNFALNEVVAEKAPELESTKIVQSTSKQGKSGQDLDKNSFTTFDGKLLNGYSQEITFAKTTGITEKQKLTMLDAKNSNLLFNVTDKDKTIAEFVEEDGKIILKLDKETVEKFKASNGTVKLALTNPTETGNYYSCVIEKLMVDEKGDISIKAANADNAYSLSALGVQIADKFGSRGVLRSDSILNVGVTDKGYEAALKGEYGCSINPNAKNLNNVLSAMYAVIERQGRTEELNSSKPINLSNVPNLEIYSVPIKLNDGSEQFLNVKKENSDTYVYMHITSEKNESKTLAPQWFKVNNASFNETNPSKDNVNDPALHFDLVAGNNSTVNVRIPLKDYKENANAIAAMQTIFSKELATAANGRDGKPAETFSRQITTSEGNEINIDAYRRADDTNAAILVDLDKVGVLSRVKDASKAPEATEGLVAGHPVEEIADPVIPTRTADSPSPTADEQTQDTEHTPAAETNAPAAPAAAAPAEEKKKESEWKKISKAALLPVGLMLAIPGVMFPPLFVAGALMLGAHALNNITPGWFGKLFRGETAEQKAERLQQENERYLSLSKADLDKNNAQIASLKAEREKIYKDPTISDAKKQKQLAKLDSQIRNLNEENIAINSTRSYVSSKNTNALLETERQKNINDQQLAKDKQKAVAKADRANAKPLEKQQKQAVKEFEQTRNGMIKLAKELDSLTKLSKTRELTPREEKRRQAVYDQLINNEVKQTYQDQRQFVKDAEDVLQAQRNLAEQHQNEIKGEIHAAEEAQQETERRIEEQNRQSYLREVEAAESSRLELNRDLKPYTPEWARTNTNTAAPTSPTAPEHEPGVVHVTPVTPTADSGRTAAREH